MCERLCGGECECVCWCVCVCECEATGKKRRVNLVGSGENVADQISDLQIGSRERNVRDTCLHSLISVFLLFSP